MALDVDQTTYDQFKETWVADIEKEPDTVRKGRAFAIKIARQWLEVDPNDDDFIYADGSRDGGIDIAYLDQAGHEENPSTDDEDDSEQIGHTWYIFQSKYGSSLSGKNAVANEGRKFLDSYSGKREVSTQSESVFEKIRTFAKGNSEGRDKIVLAIATVDSLTDEQKEQMNKIRDWGTKTFASSSVQFEVESVSLEALFDKMNGRQQRVQVDINGSLDIGGDETAVGRVTLFELYEFLKKYRDKTGELDQLYEWNVRRWLGMTKSKRVNHGIRTTLENNPKNFGVFNNGITFIVDKLNNKGSQRFGLLNPYVVNGCQTTRTIFEVLDRRLGVGGSGHNPVREEWESRYKDSWVAVKVITSAGDEKQVEDITKYTNTQNAVRERDMTALDTQFKEWKSQVAKLHGRFLEIQRGGWESRKAFEKNHPDAQPRFTSVSGTEPIIANDMIKVYGAGWMGHVGKAGRRSDDFLPGPKGAVFKEISEMYSEGDFGADDLVAAHILFTYGKHMGFGKRGSGHKRSHTRFAFYYTSVELLRDVLLAPDSSIPVTNSEVSKAIIKLNALDGDEIDQFVNFGLQVIDNYFADGISAPYRSDPAYKETNSIQLMLQSHRFDANNMMTMIPNFVGQLDVIKNAVQFSTIDGVSVRDKYRKYLSIP